MKPWGAFTIVSACFISAASIIGHNLPKPEPILHQIEHTAPTLGTSSSVSVLQGEDDPEASRCTRIQREADGILYCYVD